MQAPFRILTLNDPDATAQLAQAFAAIIRPGDTLLLYGEIGAGKSTFARAFIRARLGREEDVPSPTFTLVQTYDASDGDIWHCDLYRLTDPAEVLELGLDDAFETAICLIEWPERLGPDCPPDALRLSFAARQDAHTVSIGGAKNWQARLDVIDA